MDNKIYYIDNPVESMHRIQELANSVYDGIMAVSLDYRYHITPNFLQLGNGDQEIYDFQNNIRYRIDSAKLHFVLLLEKKVEIERRFEKIINENPTATDTSLKIHQNLDQASDEIMAIFDSIIFHLSSSFDYLSMLIQFVFGENPQNRLQWINLVKHCYDPNSEFAKRRFVTNIIRVDSEFVKSFNDYRAELIHRRKSTSLASVTWELNSGKVSSKFPCSEKIKKNLKKVISKDLNYCISYASFELIKQALLKIAYVLDGVFDEFRGNYSSHSPVINDTGFQIIMFNPVNKLSESPSVGYWDRFMKYKKLK
jgi:hypothetical protein